jgi:chemotaxis protein CheD
MRVIAVNVGDCRVSNDQDAELVTYALGSCIAVTIYDPHIQVAGLLHFMLPDSSLSDGKARDNPFMFADTGIPRLFHRAYDLGGERQRMIVRIAGGAQVLDSQSLFNIGKRNYLATRKIFADAGVLVHGEAIGGTVSRTIRLEVATGKVWLRSDSCGSSLRRVPAQTEHHL